MHQRRKAGQVRADTLAPHPNRFHSSLVPSAKALLFCPDPIDSAWLASEFERRDWDAEAVVTAAAYDRAVQWWKPDVVLLASTIGETAAAAAAALGKRQDSPPLIFLFGTRPAPIIAKMADACQADSGVSTLADFLPVVDAACEAHVERLHQSLDGAGGFSSPPEETIVQEES